MDIRGRVIAGIAQNKSLMDIFNEAGQGVSKIDFFRCVLRLIQSGDIPPVLSCYCGHDCSRCVTFLATVEDDDELKRRSAQYYKTEMNWELPLEAFHCLSGRSDEIVEGCLDCPYMKCCKEKGIAACAQCPAYPCSTLGWYIEKYVNKANQI